ncbi:DUF551 domain-containing protein [Enterobacter cloacae subsp. cloacae]|uniref:DUF551 domain-containing protein n=1 Tax=Enterobacter cloacae TaxID=550 RepID=UPI001C5ACA97|nr:DUF551 domain-containing protein [Enterobacter cloacae]MBW4228366.1 DUF551 domain-containing protein [Enterobacter cloacae subsp. cloacae]
MSTITKERIANLLQFNSEGSDCQANAEQWEVHELARIALASLEAEPVGEVSEQRDGLVMDGTVDLGGASTHRIIKGASKMKRLPLGTKFYTAPPAPVSVPDAMEMDDDFDSAFEHGKAVGWNAYRDAMLKHSEPFIVTSDHRMMEMPQVEAINAVTAMLQGVEPVTTAYKLQDGWVACSERMPEQFKAILAFNEYGEVWSGAYDRYWNFYCDNLLVEHVTHWMPLPAAPQQEA